jgi:hypothetical protein
MRRLVAIWNKPPDVKPVRKFTDVAARSNDFSVRRWQMIEVVRPFTMFTLLRICEAFEVYRVIGWPLSLSLRLAARMGAFVAVAVTVRASGGRLNRGAEVTP